MKFNHLNVPTHWQNYWTRYPEGHTILEALISWVSQVDNMVDNQNNLNTTVEGYGNRLDEFINQFGTELQETVSDTLKDWQNSGFLEVVISEALQWQLTDYIATNEADKSSLTAQLTQIAVNVKSFGATGDGVTDDTVAIQTAFDEAFNTGGSLYFPNGMYRITQSIGYSGVLAENRAFPTIFGNKAMSVPIIGTQEKVQDGSVIFVDGAGVNGINLENKAKGGTYFYGGVVKDIAIIKRGGIKQTDGSIGLNIRGALEYRLYNVSIMNFDVGFKNEWGWSWDVFGLTVVHNNIGFVLEDNSNAVGMFGIEAHQNNIGGKILSGANIAINRITLEGQDYGLIITKGEATLRPSNINIKNPYTEVARKSFISIGKDENDVTSTGVVRGVTIENVTINSDDGINPIQLDFVEGVTLKNVIYSNTIPLLSTTDKTLYVTNDPINNYDTNIGSRGSVSNRVGVKNNYNLIPNGLLQFENTRPFTLGTGWNAVFDTSTFQNERVLKLEIPNGVNANNSTRFKVNVGNELAGKRIMFSVTAMVQSGLTGMFSIYDKNMVSLNKGTNIENSLQHKNLDFICPEDGFVIALSVTNNSGDVKNLFIKHLVAIESGVGKISTSPADYTQGMSGRVSATSTGVVVPFDGFNSEDYNVFITPYDNVNTWINKENNQFTIFSESPILVNYLIIPQIGLFV